MSKRRRMQGLSMPGFMMAMVLFMICAFIAMKLIPTYLEYGGVKSAMEAMASEKYNSANEVKTALMKRLDMNYVTSIQRSDLDVESNDQKGYDISVDYYVDKPLVGNVSLTIHFSHTATTGKE